MTSNNNIENPEKIPAADRLYLRLQIFIDWLVFPLIAYGTKLYLRHIRGNKIRNLNDIREFYQNATASGRPTMVCANHLTMFDSLYLHYALNTFPGYFFNFRTFSWNTPARESFKSTNAMSLFTYLGKTIPIERQGTSEHHQRVLGKIKYLLSRGETCTIFPEGGRSRTGRVDVENVTYGVGTILKDLKDFQVLCIYMRADRQDTYSVIPSRGDMIQINMELIEPRTEQKGMRAARDISTQIIAKLKEMEDAYFASKPREDLPG